MERQLTSKLSGPKKREGEAEDSSAFSKWLKKYGDLCVATFLFWFMVGLGTWYFGYFEGCTCSYGVSRIQGCRDHTQEECRATGGNDFTYVEGVDVEACFNQIDVNGDGHLDRFEFVSFCLMEHGLLSKDQLESINRQYTSLDINGDEKVTLQMLIERGGGKHVL